MIHKDTTSPIILNNTDKENLIPNQITYYARSPGYGWGSIEVDFHRGGEYILKLQPGGELHVSFVNLEIRAKPILRLRKIEEEDTYSQPTFEGVLTNDGPMIIESLPEGRYMASVEIGYVNEGILLGKEEVELLAGQRSMLVLYLKPVPNRVTVPLKGTLIIPLTWNLEEFKLAISLLDTSLNHTTDLISIPSDEMTRQDKEAYLWDADYVQPGTYQIEVAPTGFVSVIDLGPKGDENVVIHLPPPARVTLRVVEADSGRMADVEKIIWHLKTPSMIILSVSEWVGKDPLTDLFHFTVPTGEISVDVSGIEYHIHHSENHCSCNDPFSFTILPGDNTLTLEVSRSCGFILVLKDGERTIPFEKEWWIGPVQAVEDPQLSAYSVNFLHDRCRFAVPRPGSYRFEVPPTSGYRPVGEQEVKVKPGEFTEHVIHLKREN